MTTFPYRGLGRQECIDFIRSLNRKDDEDLFLRDVAETNPELEAAKHNNRMDLTTMSRKAEAGTYSTGKSNPSATEKGQREEEFVGAERLRKDIRLIADNCMKFNRGTTYALVAEDFGSFGETELEKLCLSIPSKNSHFPKGSTSFSNNSNSSGGAKKATTLTPDTTTTTTAATPAVERQKRPRDTGKQAEPVAVAVEEVRRVDEEVEQIKGVGHKQRAGLRAPPTSTANISSSTLIQEPHHVPFHLPLRLREILVHAHLKQSTRHLLLGRAAGDTARGPAGVALGGRHIVKKEHGDDESSRRREEEEELGIPVVSEVLESFLTQVNLAIDSKAPYPMQGLERGNTDDVVVSKDAVAQQLAAQLREQQKRHYSHVVATLRKSFVDCFEPMLLYPTELADLSWFVTRYTHHATAEGPAAPRAGASSPPPSSSDLENGENEKEEEKNKKNITPPGAAATTVVPWDELVSAHYLLRFLVHVPQLAHLAATTGGGNTIGSSIRTNNNGLSAPGRAEVVVQSIVPVVEDLLFFLDAAVTQRTIGGLQ